MFTKLKESKLFKSLSEALCSARKAPAKKADATDPSKTENVPTKETSKVANPSA